MSSVSSIPDALRFLRQRGFEPAASDPLTHAFEGPLHLHAGDIQVRLEVADWEFVDYPRVALVTRPSFLPERLSNFDSTGGLCYLAEGSVVLDRFNPAGSIALCLQAAEELLNSFSEDPDRKQQAVQDEFLAYWSGGKRRAWAVIGEVAPGVSKATVSFISTDEQRGSFSVPMISSRPEEVEQVAQALGGSVQSDLQGRCWMLKTEIYPIASAAGLPTTVRQLFAYLKNWDPALSRRVQQILSTDADYLKSRLVKFAVSSPAGWIGFSFNIESFLSLPGHRRLPKVCLQHLHRSGDSIGLARLALTEIGAKFIHSRNLTHESLADKSITIIGCGAIGGFVAQAFARLGAGAGRGQMRLIDPGVLEPGNLGRHWLGMNYLFAPKATSVARELQKHFPHSTFIDCVRDVRVVTELFDTDLIVDTTGVESVSELINGHHAKRNRDAPPVLYVWVLGNGECVQGLWVDSQFGCYRCLRQPVGPAYRAERFPVLKSAPTTRMIGCQAVTPYAVGAPIEAAALATEFAVDWLKGSVSPRFRHRFRQNADVRHQKSQDVSKIAHCPACSRD